MGIVRVIIDYMGRQKPFFDNAERIIAAGYFGDATLWAPTQSLKDAYFVLSHYVEPARVQDGILKLMEVLNPVDLTGQDVIAAAKLKWDDLEDCLIWAGEPDEGDPPQVVVTRNVIDL